jgi:beta-glucosidase
VIQARHNILLAHGLAVQAFRQHAKVPLAIGVAEAVQPPVPVIETPEHINAARLAIRCASLYLNVMLDGRYSAGYLEEHAQHLPSTYLEDNQVISSPLDFIGINCYAPKYVAMDPQNPDGWQSIPLASGHPVMGIDWLQLEPSILYWGPRLLSEAWGVKRVVISENGCCAHDKLTPEKQVLDTDRLMFLRHHLRSAQRAVREGWPLVGYFYWSFLDNFEWADGYAHRFGLNYVNYTTLERTPKLSAEYYRSVIAANAVL